MTLNDSFKKAAKSALADWYAGQYDVQHQELDNLTNDLWVWYLESPSVQAKLEGADSRLVHALVARYAMQRLAGNALEADTFQGKSLFSTEAVKDALKGRSTNKYLKAVLPLAMEAIQHADDNTPGREYAESLRSRYEDKVVPSSNVDSQRLKHAHKAITDEVNVQFLTTNAAGPGSRHAVFPAIRKSVGGHGDPTGNTALLLMEHPELVSEYLEPTPWQQITQGAASEPTYDLGRARIRPAAGSYPNWMLLKHPELEDVYVEAKREELGW